MKELRPEVQLLNPQEGARRLQPLENAVSDHQRMAIRDGLISRLYLI